MALSNIIFVMILVEGGTEASLDWEDHAHLLLCIGVSAEKSD